MHQLCSTGLEVEHNQFLHMRTCEYVLCLCLSVGVCIQVWVRKWIALCMYHTVSCSSLFALRCAMLIQNLWPASSVRTCQGYASESLVRLLFPDRCLHLHGHDCPHCCYPAVAAKASRSDGTNNFKLQSNANEQKMNRSCLWYSSFLPVR